MRVVDGDVPGGIYAVVKGWAESVSRGGRPELLRSGEMRSLAPGDGRKKHFYSLGDVATTRYYCLEIFADMQSYTDDPSYRSTCL